MEPACPEPASSLPQPGLSPLSLNQAKGSSSSQAAAHRISPYRSRLDLAARDRISADLAAGDRAGEHALRPLAVGLVGAELGLGIGLGLW